MYTNTHANIETYINIYISQLQHWLRGGANNWSSCDSAMLCWETLGSGIYVSKRTVELRQRSHEKNKQIQYYDSSNTQSVKKSETTKTQIIPTSALNVAPPSLLQMSTSAIRVYVVADQPQFHQILFDNCSNWWFTKLCLSSFFRFSVVLGQMLSSVAESPISGAAQWCFFLINKVESPRGNLFGTDAYLCSNRGDRIGSTHGFTVAPVYSSQSRHNAARVKKLSCSRMNDKMLNFWNIEKCCASS